MLSLDQKDFIKKKIIRKVTTLEEDILLMEESTKPISPDNSIGRVSRMDAINNKSVAEESLRQAKERIVRLKSALKSIESDDFGVCQNCKNPIEFKRLSFIPESTRCSSCAR